MTSSRCAIAFVYALLCASSTVIAQTAGNVTGAEVTIGKPSASPRGPETGRPAWGVAAESAVVVQATHLEPPNHSIEYTIEDVGEGIGVFQSSSASNPDWWVGFQVPSGAELTRVVVEACDNTSEGQLSFGIARGIAPGDSAANIAPIVQTGTALTPGCAFFTVTPTQPTFVDNQTENYWFFNQWQGTGTAFSPALTLRSIRAYYRLQVSPAPATATFGDVPTTHPFFRFVEAIAASGITGGCGGGNYCPNDPITRGQLAVFIAAALGLHFPD